QTLWLGVENTQPNTQSTEWCEIGWTKAYNGNPNNFHYGAFRVNGEYDDFPLYFAIEIGNSYHYQIARTYDGLYDMYINFQDVADCHANPFSLYVQVGLEYTAPSAYAEVNDPRQLEWRRATDLQWFSWGSLGTPVTSYEDGAAARWSWPDFPTHGRDWTTN
ncbi:MAG: hypothetical protein WBD55_03915, partial [Dehalococcoidia bacterium]